MTNKEALEILDHNWTRLVNSDYTDTELGQALDLAIKALEFAEKYFPNSFNSYINGEQIM